MKEERRWVHVTPLGQEREDLFQLVLGMTSPKMFSDLFALAPQDGDEEKLSRWFDSRTATLGGEDVFTVVRDLVGNAAKFDYQQASRHLPAIDLPDLVPFFKNIFACNHKRLAYNGRSFEFQTPDAWKTFGVRESYRDQVFARKPSKGENVVGVGFKVFDRALDQAARLDASVCRDSGADAPLLIWSVHDQLTDHAGEKQCSFYGVVLNAENRIAEVLPDWKLLLKLNKLRSNREPVSAASDIDIDALRPAAEAAIGRLLAEEDFKPNQPIFVLEGIVLP